MKVAVVNDMFVAVESLRRSVLHGGHELAWIARNGISNPPDLVLMDLYMPVMDGLRQHV